MNILFGTYPWAFDCPGGGERQLLAWRSALMASGLSVKKYDLWEPNLQNYNLFHFFSVMPGSIQLCNYIKSQGLKLVISPNLWVTEDTKDQYPHESILMLLHLADAIVVNSILEATELSKVYRLPREIFKVVYNGYDPLFLDQVSASLIFAEFPKLEGRKFILNVANIEPRKNQLAFLNAMLDFDELHLVNVGQVRDSDYAKECRACAGGRFIELGVLPYGGKLLRSALAACEAFAMPSQVETPSIAALEAASYGKPLIVTSQGSTMEYFGVDAMYINPNDLESISSAIRRLSNSSQETHSSVTRRARSFTWQSSAESLLRVYQEQLN